MPYTERERQRIAETVRRARIAHKLDKEPAARAAEVNSITWKRVEDAEGVRDASLGKILASLDLPSADEILAGDSEPANPNETESVDTEQSAPPILDVATGIWECLRELAESPPDDPNRLDKANRAVVYTADLLIDLLLALNAGPAAKPLIQEMSNKAYELLQLNQENKDDLETAPESSAPSAGDEDKEELDDAQVLAAARAHLSGKGVRVQDAYKAH